MSWATILSPGIRQEPVDGGYNIHEGLREWRLGVRPYGLGDKALAGAGGVDVVFLTDSIFQTGGTFTSVDNTVNRVRQLLQRRFNPPDIEGGFGFMPIIGHPPTIQYIGTGFGNANMRVNGSNALWPAYGPATLVGAAGLSKGIALRHVRANSDLSGQTCWWLYANALPVDHLFQDSAASTMRQAQIVFGSNSGDGTFRFGWGDFTATSGGTQPYTNGSGAAPVYATNVDANAFSVDVDADAAEAVGLRTSLANAATSSAATHWIQVDQLEANNPVNIEGLLLYRDDNDCGVRTHNLGIGGAKSGDWNDAVTLAGLARFGSRAGTIPGENAQNAKLVVIELGINDEQSAVSLATYRANLAALIQSVQAWPSKPSVLMVYPMPRDHASALANWRSFIEVGKSLASEYNCAVLDIWTTTRDSPHGNGSAGFMKDRGFYSDGVHMTKHGHDWCAGLILGALTVGL